MSDVLAVAEHRQGELRDVSNELVTVGRELVSETGGDLHVAVIGAGADDRAAELSCEGVDTVYTMAHSDEFNHGVYCQVVRQLQTNVDPQFVLMPHTANGLDYAPAVANDLSLPLVTDAIDVDYDGSLEVTREMYGSKVETTLEVVDERAAVTIRPTEWEPATGDGDPEMVTVDTALDSDAIGVDVAGFEEATDDDVDITDAEFIVSIGRGIDEEENLELIERLVDVADATLASSRPIVDNGWLPQSRQVGQSGKQVSPDIYLAIGISGAVQHVAGMKSSDTIIAM
ncbi:electron transfer flavoprotein subunit alpha/FixB family protein [Natribaculum luteum]|uniref:Electron transfer flavoprotein subunit alpha/FixB family protein n=1 Tax=Natribaculum luteum TaxID=1586232 RepID=A0ABD5P0G5_9EURY|nr:electron transfer flavoprotein subunit alpha/FixB family protein [Natribaculum luteum]